jgi:hypothetical protein
MNQAKLQALHDRAVHPSTPTEEARTCALIYLRAIDEKRKAEPVSSIDEFIGRKPKSADVDNTDEDGWTLIRSKFHGWCRACRSDIAEGETIWWKPRKGARHERCRP